MLNDKSLSRYGRHIYLLKRIRAVSTVVIIFVILLLSIFFINKLKNGISNEKRDLLTVWNSGDYEKSYELSRNALLQKPVDLFLLTMNGFSAYQIGISQINNHNRLLFIDECIFSLRKALLNKESANDGRIFYVLGKAYGYKGKEYSDLAIKYLEIANNLSYDAQDIPEYLGLAYAASGDYRNSVAAFSLAFDAGRPPSDNLLLSIARSYIAMEDYGMATGYLQRCIEISPDSKSVVMARMLLAEIYKVTGQFENSERQYLTILETSEENAEVRFQLGELYNSLGDVTRARAQWRIAYRQDPAHARARQRLNI
jgi:tetratricopeptide (TPR) repeat protein